MAKPKEFIAIVNGRKLPEYIWKVEMSNGEIKEIHENDAWLMVTHETEWTPVDTGATFRRGQQILIAVFWEGWPGEPTLEKKEEVELLDVFKQRK